MPDPTPDQTPSRLPEPEETAPAQAQAPGPATLLPQTPSTQGLPIPDMSDAVSALIRSVGARSVVRSVLEHGTREKRRDEARIEQLQEELSNVRTELAVTKADLRHAGERSAAQLFLQLLGGASLGYGASEVKTTWAGLIFIATGLAMAIVGCLPILLLPRKRN